MKLYKLSAGIILQHNYASYLLSAGLGYPLINRDNLYPVSI